MKYNFRQVKCTCDRTSTNDQLVCHYEHDHHPHTHSGVHISGCVVGGVVVSPGGVILTGKCRYCRYKAFSCAWTTLIHTIKSVDCS